MFQTLWNMQLRPAFIVNDNCRSHEHNNLSMLEASTLREKKNVQQFCLHTAVAKNNSWPSLLSNLGGQDKGKKRTGCGEGGVRGFSKRFNADSNKMASLCAGVGGTVASESAVRSAGTLLSQVRAPPLVPWPDGGPET
ncbi:hypothetical protein PoB_000246700 [Plakobranchus ocellatus]|uniref:DDE-1 domain-containing protein n=1 Tax=Plakobranchus ocellatus TaxID=259542 RepID=A0AAV3XZN0_9GAST|nr:hypothetical protein PoB_000246700 [Plakobranchus ocellatus]